MYSFEPNEEQKMLIDAIGRYARTELRETAHDADEAREIPKAVIEKGWELGFLQASVPENYGGFGEHSAVTGVLAAEELAWGDLSGAMSVLTPALFSLPLLIAGSEEQKQKYLPKVIEAEWRPYSSALIEKAYDFDPNDLKTFAVEAGDEYIINGEKVFVPFADKAEAIIVYANLEGNTQGFIVHSGSAGLTIGEREKHLGWQAIPLYTVRFDEVRVQKDERLGGPDGHTFEPILTALRLASASMAVGVSRAALEYSRDYAKEREAFGVKIAQKQAIAFMLAEMATEIEAVRLLTWEAAWMADQGMEEAAKSAYLAQVGAMDMAMMVTDRAVQILGGHGYIREHPVEMWMRNGRGFAAFTGLAMV